MSVSQVRNYTAFPSRRLGWTWDSFENEQNLQPVLMLCGALASGQHCSLGLESQRFTNNVIINQGKDLPFSLVLEAFKGLPSTPSSQAGGGGVAGTKFKEKARRIYNSIVNTYGTSNNSSIQMFGLAL